MNRYSKHRVVFVFLIVSFLVDGRSSLCLSTPISALPELTQLIGEALSHNKEIKSIQDRIESLKETVVFEGSLPDPKLGIALLNLPTDSFQFDEQPMTQKQLFISQMFPWFGKLDLKLQIASIKVLRQEALLDVKRLEISRGVATAYYELWFIKKSKEINNRLTNIIDQILKVSETGYETGRVLQHDIFRAQVELSKLTDEQIDLNNRYRVGEDKINALINRSGYVPVILSDKLEYPDVKLNLDALNELALKQNPWVKIKQLEVDSAKIIIDLAKKDYWPDMNAKVSYGQRDKDINGKDFDDFFSASLEVNIPLWKKTRQDRQLASAVKAYDSSDKMYENFTETLPHNIDALVSEIHDAQTRFMLFRDSLIPQARQWAISSLSAYEVGKIEFNTMIDAQIRLLRFELQADNYLFMIYKKRAEIEEVIGGPVL